MHVRGYHNRHRTAPTSAHMVFLCKTIDTKVLRTVVDVQLIEQREKYSSMAFLQILC